MHHLTEETLSRLVDEAPTALEEGHLRSCSRCAGTLEELGRQTRALASLPAFRPPPGGWRELEARLSAEGLIENERASTARTSRGSPGSGWLQAAAAVVLFLAGTGVGSWAAGAGGPGTPESASTTSRATAAPDGRERLVGPDPGPGIVGRPSTVEEAAASVRASEERYIDALLTYRQLLGSSADPVPADDPAGRYAALETLVAASQAAIREAPADPFLNGVLASAVAERQAALRQISTSSGEDWF